jgi:hypothetical protein
MSMCLLEIQYASLSLSMIGGVSQYVYVLRVCVCVFLCVCVVCMYSCCMFVCMYVCCMYVYIYVIFDRAITPVSLGDTKIDPPLEAQQTHTHTHTNNFLRITPHSPASDLGKQVDMYIYVCKYLHICMCIYVHTLTHTHIMYMYMYVYILTYTLNM